MSPHFSYEAYRQFQLASLRECEQADPEILARLENDDKTDSKDAS